MADSQNQEILRVEGGTPPSVASASNAIRAEARRLTSDLAGYAAEQARLEVALSGEVTDKTRAAYQARLAVASSAAEQTRILISQQKAQYEALNAVIAQRTTAAIGAATPPPPAPPAPPAPPSSGGGAGDIGAALLASGQTLLLRYIGLQAIFRGIHEIVELGLGTLKNWAEEGVRLNALFEVLQVGLAASVAQAYTVVGADGQQITGLEKINVLKGVSLDLENKIVAAAFRSGSSLDSFIQVFRLAVTPAAALGASLDQTVEIVRRLTTASSALGVPLEQVKLQVAQILAGHITSRTTLARELGITPELLTQARETGTVIDLLFKKTQAYSDAEGLLGETFTFVMNRAQLLGQVLLKEATTGGFKEIRDALRELVDSVIVFDRASGTMKVNPEFADVIRLADEAFKNLVDAVVQGAPAIAAALSGILTITVSLTQTMAQFGQIFVGIAAIAARGRVTTAAGEVEGLQGELQKAVQSGDTARADLLRKESLAAQARLAIAEKEESSALRTYDAIDRSVQSLSKVEEAASKGLEELAEKADKARLTVDAQDPLGVFGKGTDLGKAFGPFGPGPIKVPVTLVPNLGEISTPGVNAARDRADAEVRVAQIKAQEAAVDTELARLENQRGDLGLVDYATKKGVLDVEVARLRVEEARARLAGATAAVQEPGLTGAALQSARSRQANDQALVALAEAKLEKSRQDLALNISLAQAEQRRVEVNTQLALISGKEADDKLALQSLSARSAQFDEVALARRRGDITVDESRLKLQEAGLRVQEAQATLDAAGQGTNLSRKVTAQRDLDVAVERQRVALADVDVVQEQVAESIQKAAEAQRRLTDAAAASTLQADRRAGTAVIEERILAAQRGEIAALGEFSTRRDLDLAVAQGRIAVEDSILARRIAQVRLAEDQLKLDQAEYNLRVALQQSQGNSEAPAVRAAIEAAQKAGLQVQQDEYVLNVAILAVNKTNLGVFNSITDAVVRTIEDLGGMRAILSDLGDVAGLFGGGIPKGLTQFIQGFEALGKVQANFVKTAREDFASVFGVKDAKANVQTFGDALKVAFTNFDGFKSLFKNGGKGIIDLAGSIVAPLASGIQNLLQGGTLGGLLGGAQIGLTIGSAFKAIGGTYGALIGAGIGVALKAHNPIIGALGGALAGGVAGFYLGGPIGAAIGAAIGGIVGGFTAAQKKETDRIVKQITTAVNTTVLAVTAGTSTIGKSIDELLRERADAVSQLSGRKGAGDKLKQITDQIDQAVAQLKAQQKQIFDQFQSQLRVLSLVPQIQSVGQAIETLNDNVRKFLDAGGSALDAQRYLAFSLQAIYRDTNSQLTSAQKTTIDLLLQEVDLQTQREQIVKNANDQENQIRQSTGLVRVQSQAQTAGQQIAKIEADKKTQLDANQKQLDQLHAQTDGLAELFHLGTDEASLQAARLAIMKQQTAETILQIKALQDFLSLNAAAFAAANKVALATGVTVPSLSNGALVQGGPVINIGTVSITAGPGTSPQQLFQNFVDGIRTGVGSSRWRLDAVR